MAYINPAPGTSNQVTLTLDVASSVDDITQGVGALSVPAL